MQRVQFWIMRHGEQVNDNLTPLGEAQVRASARKHLPRPTSWRAYHSGMNRADQTVRAALAEIGVIVHKVAPRGLGVGEATVQVEPGFGYQWVLEDPSLPRLPFSDAVEKELEAHHGKNVTAFHWLEKWGPAWAIRVRLADTLMHIAKASLADQDCEGHILVGSHSPTAEFAAPVPRSVPKLRLGDILRYTVEADPRNARIVETAYYPCPPIS